MKTSDWRVLYLALTLLTSAATVLGEDGNSTKNSAEKEVADGSARSVRSLGAISRYLFGGTYVMVQLGHMPPDHPLVKYPAPIQSSAKATNGRVIAAVPGMNGLKSDFSSSYSSHVAGLPPPLAAAAASPSYNELQDLYEPLIHQPYVAPTPVPTPSPAHLHMPGMYYSEETEEKSKVNPIYSSEAQYSSPGFRSSGHVIPNNIPASDFRQADSFSQQQVGSSVATVVQEKPHMQTQPKFRPATTQSQPVITSSGGVTSISYPTYYSSSDPFEVYPTKYFQWKRPRLTDIVYSVIKGRQPPRTYPSSRPVNHQFSHSASVLHSGAYSYGPSKTEEYKLRNYSPTKTYHTPTDNHVATQANYSPSPNTEEESQYYPSPSPTYTHKYEPHPSKHSYSQVEEENFPPSSSSSSSRLEPEHASSGLKHTKHASQRLPSTSQQHDDYYESVYTSGSTQSEAPHPTLKYRPSGAPPTSSSNHAHSNNRERSNYRRPQQPHRARGYSYNPNAIHNPHSTHEERRHHTSDSDIEPADASTEYHYTESVYPSTSSHAPQIPAPTYPSRPIPTSPIPTKESNIRVKYLPPKLDHESKYADFYSAPSKNIEVHASDYSSGGTNVMHYEDHTGPSSLPPTASYPPYEEHEHIEDPHYTFATRDDPTQLREFVDYPTDNSGQQVPSAPVQRDGHRTKPRKGAGTLPTSSFNLKYGPSRDSYSDNIRSYSATSYAKEQDHGHLRQTDDTEYERAPTRSPSHRKQNHNQYGNRQHAEVRDPVRVYAHPEPKAYPTKSHPRPRYREKTLSRETTRAPFKAVQNHRGMTRHPEQHIYHDDPKDSPYYDESEGHGDNTENVLRRQGSVKSDAEGVNRPKPNSRVTDSLNKSDKKPLTSKSENNPSYYHHKGYYTSKSGHGHLPSSKTFQQHQPDIRGEKKDTMNPPREILEGIQKYYEWIGYYDHPRYEEPQFLVASSTLQVGNPLGLRQKLNNTLDTLGGNGGFSEKMLLLPAQDVGGKPSAGSAVILHRKAPTVLTPRGKLEQSHNSVPHIVVSSTAASESLPLPSVLLDKQSVGVRKVQLPLTKSERHKPSYQSQSLPTEYPGTQKQLNSVQTFPADPHRNPSNLKILNASSNSPILGPQTGPSTAQYSSFSSKSQYQVVKNLHSRNGNQQQLSAGSGSLQYSGAHVTSATGQFSGPSIASVNQQFSNIPAGSTNQHYNIPSAGTSVPYSSAPSASANPQYFNTGPQRQFHSQLRSTSPAPQLSQHNTHKFNNLNLNVNNENSGITSPQTITSNQLYQTSAFQSESSVSGPTSAPLARDSSFTATPTTESIVNAESLEAIIRAIDAFK